MSQRDQPGSGQRAGGGGRGASNPPGRAPIFDDDGFELPVWGAQSANSRAGSRSSRPSRSQSSEPPAEDGPRRASGTERIPSLGDAFGRRESRRRSSQDSAGFDDDTRAAVDDPYDRLRVRSARQREAAPVDELDAGAWTGDAGGYGSGRATYPGNVQPRRRRKESARQVKTPNLGAAVQFANQIDRPVAITLGIALVSLVLMAATVAARQGKLVDWMPIHLNAAGSPDRWGSPATLWRLPLIAVMATLMAAVLAWFSAKRDAFAVQFLLAATLLIQALCWIALINLAW